MEVYSHISEFTSTSPLIYACMINNIALAKRCIDDGEDPNTKDTNGASAIEIAASWSSELILNYLLDLYVKVEQPAKLIYCIKYNKLI